MDNYKIRLYTVQENHEAQTLFLELGYTHKFRGHKVADDWKCPFIYVENGFLGPADCSDDFEESEIKEISIQGLRDLAALKRNDPNDALYVGRGGSQYYVTEKKSFYLWDGIKWTASTISSVEGLKPFIKEEPINQLQEQAPALISGADALRALADGKEVEFYNPSPENQGWMNYAEGLTAREFLGGYFVCSDDGEKINTKFRLKPQTIKIELELPKPFEPKDGEVYYYLKPSNAWGFGRGEWGDDSMQEKYIQFGAWRTEEEIKQVVEQLRKIRGVT